MTDDQMGALRLYVNVDVPLSEMRQWDPDRINRFFDGLASVLAARDGNVRDITERRSPAKQ